MKVKLKYKGKFSDIAIGKSEYAAIVNAKKWEDFHNPPRYKVRNIKLIKKPSFWDYLCPFASHYYVVSFDCYELL